MTQTRSAQQLGNSSRLRGRSFPSGRSYSLQRPSSVCSSTPGSRHGQAAGEDTLGSAVPAGRVRRREGTGLKTNAERERPAIRAEQAPGGGSCEETGWEQQVFARSVPNSGNLSWWVTRDAQRTPRDLQGSLQNTDSARFQTEAALPVPGAGNVLVHQRAQLRDSRTPGTCHPAPARQRPAPVRDTRTARGCPAAGSQ